MTSRRRRRRTTTRAEYSFLATALQVKGELTILPRLCEGVPGPSSVTLLLPALPFYLYSDDVHRLQPESPGEGAACSAQERGLPGRCTLRLAARARPPRCGTRYTTDMLTAAVACARLGARAQSRDRGGERRAVDSGDATYGCRRRYGVSRIRDEIDVIYRDTRTQGRMWCIRNQGIC